MQANQEEQKGCIVYFLLEKSQCEKFIHVDCKHVLVCSSSVRMCFHT